MLRYIAAFEDAEFADGDFVFDEGDAPPTKVRRKIGMKPAHAVKYGGAKKGATAALPRKKAAKKTAKKTTTRRR